MVCGLVGYDVTMTKEAVGNAVFLANAAKLSFVLAAFHTCFNLANTGILIWFIPQIEKLVCKVIKQKENEEEEEARLKYIQSGIIKTPEIAVLQAQKEIGVFGIRMQRMFGMVRDLLEEKDGDKFTKLYSRIEKYEGISDNMEIEIARYLEQVGDAHLSDETKYKIRQMMRQISELESIGDACFNLARTLNRHLQSQKEFTEKQYQELRGMMQLADDSLTQMNRTLSGRREEQNINETFRIENDINALRNRLKSDNIQAINDHEYDYAIGTMYTDLISECEKLGDYVVNVVEARLGK
jgi:phosphate:Na+ symporter